jgi:hypothetical protein
MQAGGTVALQKQVRDSHWGVSKMRIRLKHLAAVLVVALTISTFGTLPKPAAAQGAWCAEFFANRDLTGAPCSHLTTRS